MRALTILCVLSSLVVGLFVLPCSGQELLKQRSELEAELPGIQAAYREAPGDDYARRAYASRLYLLGNVWQANDVIAPLATSTSTELEDLELGLKLALMVGDYERSEFLGKRLREIAPHESNSHRAALRGLVMTYYQTDRYDKVQDIELSESQPRGLRSLLTFMKKFEGQPYQLEWNHSDKVAHLPIVNDFTPPGALPLMKLWINGHEVEFILDTGGDRLYIDKSIAAKVGIKNITTRQAKYAYTNGKSVDEFLGMANSVRMGEVTLKNVPVIVAQWKSLGLTSDGVVTTQILKQFLSTIDYPKKRITLRERTDAGRSKFLESLGDAKPSRMPFFLSGTHLMFAKGSLNDRKDLNLFVDSGLASNMELVILDETVEELGLEKVPLRGTKYYSTTLDSHGLGKLVRGKAQALGNVLVEENSYRRYGFLFDALISHQYLRHLGSWTIDFDTMTFYFSGDSENRAEAAVAANEEKPKANVTPDDAKTLNTYRGEYTCELIKSEIKITVANERLIASADGNLRGKFTLRKIGDHEYEAEAVPQPVTLRFQQENGVTTKVLVNVSGQGPFPFRRKEG